MICRIFLLCLLSALPALAGPIPADCRQMVVGIAHDWDDSHVTIQRFERGGKGWQPGGESLTGRLGRSVLVWGRGLHESPAGAVLKVEGDSRAPAGVFALGSA